MKNIIKTALAFGNWKYLKHFIVLGFLLFIACLYFLILNNYYICDQKTKKTEMPKK